LIDAFLLNELDRTRRVDSDALVQLLKTDLLAAVLVERVWSLLRRLAG